MFLKLTIPPQKTYAVEINDKIEVVFEVIGYHKNVKFYQEWRLSNNSVFTNTIDSYTIVILQKHFVADDSPFSLTIFWKENTSSSENKENKTTEISTDLIVSAVELINDYPIP